MSNIFKSITVEQIFQDVIHLVFGKLSHSKVSHLLSKSIVTPKLLQLEYFPKICCSATLSLTIRWHIVWGSVACNK